MDKPLWMLLPCAVRGMKRQNRDAGGQLPEGQQGIPLEFLGSLA